MDKKEEKSKMIKLVGSTGFGYALEILKRNEKYGIRLPKWSEDVFIRVQYPDKDSKMTAPYLYVESRFGRVPWKETMIEIFSNYWEVWMEEE